MSEISDLLNKIGVPEDRCSTTLIYKEIIFLILLDPEGRAYPDNLFAYNKKGEVVWRPKSYFDDFETGYSYVGINKTNQLEAYNMSGYLQTFELDTWKLLNEELIK